MALEGDLAGAMPSCRRMAMDMRGPSESSTPALPAWCACTIACQHPGGQVHDRRVWLRTQVLFVLCIVEGSVCMKRKSCVGCWLLVCGYVCRVIAQQTQHQGVSVSVFRVLGFG